MSTDTKHWLVKQEPTAYAWKQLVADGRTAWTGVRNFQARNHLASMRVGDSVLFYHSVIGKEIVGIAKVIATAYPDPTASSGSWLCVDLAPHRELPHPVSLEAMKAHPKLREMRLVRQSRLSVVPVSHEDFEEITSMAERGGVAS